MSMSFNQEGCTREVVVPARRAQTKSCNRSAIASTRKQEAQVMALCQGRFSFQVFKIEEHSHR